MTVILVNISLRAWHPMVSADEIARNIGLPVEVSHSVGGKRMTPSGRALEGEYDRTYVSMAMVRKKIVELDEELEHCHESISQCGNFIRTLVETGGEVEFYVSAFLNGLCGFEFDSAFLSRIAATGMGISVELYPKEDGGGKA